MLASLLFTAAIAGQTGPQFRLLVKDGDPVPGESVTFDSVTRYAMLGAGGHVLFAATWTDAGSSFRSALFRRDPSGAILEIAREGETIATLSGDRLVPNLTYGPGIIAGYGAIVFSKTDSGSRTTGARCSTRRSAIRETSTWAASASGRRTDRPARCV
jgi:hypothetical protein